MANCSDCPWNGKHKDHTPCDYAETGFCILQDIIDSERAGYGEYDHEEEEEDNI